jgi:hypothetical protein
MSAGGNMTALEDRGVDACALKADAEMKLWWKHGTTRKALGCIRSALKLIPTPRQAGLIRKFIDFISASHE